MNTIMSDLPLMKCSLLILDFIRKGMLAYLSSNVIFHVSHKTAF